VADPEMAALEEAQGFLRRCCGDRVGYDEGGDAREAGGTALPDEAVRERGRYTRPGERPGELVDAGVEWFVGHIGPARQLRRFTAPTDDV